MRPPLPAFTALLVLTLAGRPLPSRADPPASNAHLAQARSALDNGDLDRAGAELQRALARPGNSDDDRVEIYKLQGIVALSKGDRATAKAALFQLLQVRPDYVLPKGTSPKLRDLFVEAQAEARQHPEESVALEFNPPAQLTAGGPARFAARTSPLPEEARAKLWYRRSGAHAFAALDLASANGEVSGTLPASELPVGAAPFALEYYLEVDDADGHRIGGIGDRRAALSTPVKAPQIGGQPPAKPVEEAASEPAWYGHWYVWAGVGALAAVGAGAAVYYATRPSTGTLPVTITITGP